MIDHHAVGVVTNHGVKLESPGVTRRNEHGAAQVINIDTVSADFSGVGISIRVLISPPACSTQSWTALRIAKVVMVAPGKVSMLGDTCHVFTARFAQRYFRADAYTISYCYDKYAWAPEMIGPVPALTIENYDYTWNSSWAKMWVDYKLTLTGIGKQTKDINAYVEGTRIKYVYAVYDR